MGGRAAEEIIFEEVSTGAQNDLERASDIAKRMVTEYGMSKLGPMSYEKERNPMFLNSPLFRNGGYSEHTAQEIDKEVKRIIDEIYQGVKTILSDNKGALERLAAELIEKETIEGKELRAILKECGIEKPSESV
jgi:cell division protease FtsH